MFKIEKNIVPSVISEMFLKNQTEWLFACTDYKNNYITKNDFVYRSYFMELFTQ